MSAQVSQPAKCEPPEAWRRAASWLLAGAIFVVVSASLLSSCSQVISPAGPDCFMVVTDYMLTIDSMRVTTPIVLGDTLRVWLWGPIGTEGTSACYGFNGIMSHMESDSLLTLAAAGWLGSGSCCPDDTLAYLDGFEYAYVPTVAGHTTVILYNGEGPDMVDTVRVLGGVSAASRARSN